MAPKRDSTALGKEPIGTMLLEFSKDNTLESAWNPPGDNGELQGVEDDWALAPGMSARYHVGYVTIPETWDGDKEIEVYVTAVYTVLPGAMSAQAEGDSIEFIPNQRARSKLYMDDGETAVAYAGDYSRSDATATKKTPGQDGNQNDSQNPSGQGKDSNASSAGKSSSPNTGDALPFVAAAAVAGAAGLAARKAYRSLGEHEEAEGAD